MTSAPEEICACSSVQARLWQHEPAHQRCVVLSTHSNTSLSLKRTLSVQRTERCCLHGRPSRRSPSSWLTKPINHNHDDQADHTELVKTEVLPVLAFFVWIVDDVLLRWHPLVVRLSTPSQPISNRQLVLRENRSSFMLMKATFLLGVLFALNVSALAAIVFARLLAVVALPWVVILRAALPRVTARLGKGLTFSFIAL